MKRFVGKTGFTPRLRVCFQKKVQKKKGSHFSGSCFECPVNDNVTLNTQFSIS